MALFAAYANVQQESESSQNTSENSSETWLQNSSFKIDVTPFQNTEVENMLHPGHYKATKSSESDAEEENSTRELHKKHKKKKKKSKKSHKRKKEESDPENSPTNEYLIDKTRVTEYKYAKTISRPMAPRYRVYKYIGLPKLSKKKKFKRYYQLILDKHVDGSASEGETLTQKTLDSYKDKKLQNLHGEDTLKNITMIEEQEISRQTANFNRELQVDPYQINTWIRYVNFQDTIFNFEKTFRKGSIAKGQRVTAERKLAILDKALQHNPDCETLLRMRLNIAVGVFPADELQTQLGKLVERDSVNIILWQGYIEATQCSMSHCTAPSVINLYIKCLHTLHTIRRTAKINRVLLEENILRMLFQCGLFLRQAGLFEQLWTLLRLYLELNLTSDGEGNLFGSIPPDDRQLIDLEDTVLKSQLPIHELWLRVEKLREASHWLPITDGGSEDPQRLVFTEDVSELIHPITVPGNTFRLTVTILTLLKIPLLPCRHASMKEFGIDYVPWSLDSIETLLSMFCPLYPLDMSNDLLLTLTQKLAVGPQYLKTLPGQEEYLQFILTVMQSCGNCLTGRNRLAVTVWWFRFLRLLTVLEKRGFFKVTSSFKKKLRSDMKRVLRENSASVVLFKEYALVEFEGSFDAGVNVLKTALNMNCTGSLFSKSKEEQSDLVSTLRTLVEIYVFRKSGKIDNETKQTCLRLISSVILGEFSMDNAPRFITQDVLSRVKEKFVQINEDVLGKSSEMVEGVGHFLPDFTTDWLILNGYLLLVADFAEARIFIENILAQWQTLERDNLEDVEKMAALRFRKEILLEFLVAILFKTCVDVPGSGMYPILDRYLQMGIRQFPNSMFLLATLAKVQSFSSNYGQPWWRMQDILLKTGHALPMLFAVLIANQRSADLCNWVDTITGTVILEDNGFRNRMLNLFKRITKSDMCTRRCGLVWRLYLQFLHSYFDHKQCRAAYYLAVEELPWLKALYIDAAIYIPEDLAQIQDLIIEKQLRIHVTPEELDVLRD